MGDRITQIWLGFGMDRREFRSKSHQFVQPAPRWCFPQLECTRRVLAGRTVQTPEKRIGAGPRRRRATTRHRSLMQATGGSAGLCLLHCLKSTPSCHRGRHAEEVAVPPHVASTRSHEEHVLGGSSSTRHTRICSMHGLVVP